nr:MAG TPA: Putative golgin subfamily A member 2-like protein 5 [Crassvirales sp.]
MRKVKEVHLYWQASKVLKAAGRNACLPFYFL